LEIEPDASPTLIKAVQQQQNIGWKHWFYGRHSSTWGQLFNHEIDKRQPGANHITAETWDRDLILLTWNFAHEMWINRNKIEHDHDGNPNKRAKQKIINHILGIANSKGPQPYKLDELTEEKLQSMPITNLKSIHTTIKQKIKKKKKQEHKNRKKLRQLNRKP
jgi:hypothetical protein